MSKAEKKDKKPKDETQRDIAINRRARFDYFIEDTYEAGLQLEGWEVKSLREGRGQITEAYVTIKNGELWLLGAHITPLIYASTHVHPDQTRTRKLLMQKKQIATLTGKIERAGYTLIPLDLHWTRGRVKVSVGLAKGKKLHDKRAAIKDRDWQREQGRLLRH